MSIDEPHDDPALDRVEQLLRASGPPPEPSAALRARLLEIPTARGRVAPPAAPAQLEAPLVEPDRVARRERGARGRRRRARGRRRHARRRQQRGAAASRSR